jgi:putative transposase
LIPPVEAIEYGYVAAAFMRALFASMPHRHENIRLASTNYLGQRWYFVTLCCEAKRKFLASKSVADALIEYLKSEAVRHMFSVYAYCLMPDHFHILAHGQDSASDLLAFVKSFKKITSFEFEERIGAILWQKKFYDRILRPSDSVTPIAAYIWMNPVRAGLCDDPKSYRFSGSLVLDWAAVNISARQWVPPWKQNSKSPA